MSVRGAAADALFGRECVRPKRSVLHLAAGVVTAAFTGSAMASEPKLLAYGRHLSGECSACHRIDGVDNGIPSITGRDPEEFMTTLTFYRNGGRTNPAMVSVAQSLDDAQVKALAAYYGSLSKPLKGLKPAPKK